ncbi:MAG: xanthine dehydrogenase [Ruminococcaceae bacterium]|nr:xanthine dehydrogenase [Oscillospiraceae bacterium]
MIPFDFEYYRPDTMQEATDIFRQLESEGKTPVYYSGGTELISMARVGNVIFDAAIDIKNIPECRVLEYDQDNNLVLGSALTLSEITESNQFPLLGKTAGRIADHTVQCKITLGGNLASTIIYRETVLPLLTADSRAVVASHDGLREYPINEIFNQRLNLEKGSFLVKIVTNRGFAESPYFHIKKTKNEKIDYPLLTTAGIKVGGMLRIAFSGLCSYPFRSMQIENILNGTGSFEERADKIADTVSENILNDTSGSSEYRKFVLKNTIINVLETMKDV